MWSQSTNVTDGQTDRQTDAIRWQYRSIAIALSGNNWAFLSSMCWGSFGAQRRRCVVLWRRLAGQREAGLRRPTLRIEQRVRRNVVQEPSPWTRHDALVWPQSVVHRQLGGRRSGDDHWSLWINIISLLHRSARQSSCMWQCNKAIWNNQADTVHVR